MSEKAILVVSFGTTHAGTERKNIGAVERHIAAAFPTIPVARAYTSGIVRGILAKRGEEVPDVPSALRALARSGAREVAIQPTHLIPGEEYEKVCEAARAAAPEFERVRVGAPLLATTEDIRETARCLTRENPLGPDECLVLMGHGTVHFCNTVYAAMDYLCGDDGHPHVVVGTVEAYPDLDAVLRRVEAGGYRRAVLTPLMLVAGDHAVNDMAGPSPDSWKNRLGAAGLEVRVALKGLGEYEAVRSMYVRHLREVMQCD